MSAFGIDIGSESIKTAQVVKEKVGFRLSAVGMIKNPISDISLANDSDLSLLAEAIKKLKNEAKISGANVIASIPERLIFSHILEIAKMKDSELDQALIFESENLIPRPLSEVNLDWQIIKNAETEKAGKMTIYLVAAPKVLVEKYIKVFKMADLVPVGLETETLSVVRFFNLAYSKSNLMIVNFGLKTMDLIVLREGSLLTVRSFPTSGEAISRSLSSSLGIDLSVAEEYKKTYGLTNNVEGKVSSVIEPILSTVLNEVKKAVKFYEERFSDSLKLVVLAGGSSLIPGLVEYFVKALNLEVQIADPLSMFQSGQISPEFRRSSPFFTVSLGLALKGAK